MSNYNKKNRKSNTRKSSSRNNMTRRNLNKNDYNTGDYLHDSTFRKVNKKETKRLSKSRVLLFEFIVIILIIVLICRVGYIQFVKGAYYKQMEYNQSTSNITIAAKRGTIYDSNKKALAISADVDTITVNPKSIVVKEDGKVNETKTEELKERLAHKFADVFEIDYNETLEKLKSTNEVEKIVSKVENDQVEPFRTWLKENKITSGINIDADTKRYYPYNNLASNLIGVCGTDNQGLDGIELEYDNLLKGTDGRITTSISGSRDAIPDGTQSEIAAENGSDIYLTIDSNIQAIAEKYLKQAVEENNCKRGGNVIIEDPTTGEILAMCTYPDFNLNDPYTPNSTISDGWDKLSSEEKSSKILSMWRNRAVLDTYEPGSTFKVITASAALEENITQTDVPGDFYCSGKQNVAGVTIDCADAAGHGSQSLRNALENSCNPALIQLGQRIGKSTFYKYLRAYGLFEKTGIDLPSEGTSSFWSEENVGPVELATMSFGQRFTITPMQLVKAVSAIANDGVMLTPHVVKKIVNNDTGAVTTIEKNEERQVISKDTADKMKDMMKDVVEVGGGSYAKVQGYTIGGKTGTSEADPNHPENGYVASFLAIAPVQNTKLVCLLTLYGPQSSNHYGGRIAAPAVSQILTEVLPYLDIPSNNAKEDDNSSSSDIILTPNITGKTYAEAKEIIEKAGLTFKCDGKADDIIAEQTPKSGANLMSGGIVRAYTNGNTEKVTAEVPDLKGVTLSQAKIMLKAKNLNISATGSGVIISQSPKAGEKVEEGTLINVTLQKEVTRSQN